MVGLEIWAGERDMPPPGLESQKKTVLHKVLSHGVTGDTRGSTGLLAARESRCQPTAVGGPPGKAAWSSAPAL